MNAILSGYGKGNGCFDVSHLSQRKGAFLTCSSKGGCTTCHCSDAGVFVVQHNLDGIGIKLGSAVRQCNGISGAVHNGVAILCGSGNRLNAAVLCAIFNGVGHLVSGGGSGGFSIVIHPEAGSGILKFLISHCECPGAVSSCITICVIAARLVIMLNIAFAVCQRNLNSGIGARAADSSRIRITV